MTDFSVLKGKTLTEVKVSEESITIVCLDGDIYNMNHWQDCCESVVIESIVGDLNDVLNSEILLAEEVSSETPPEGFNPDYEPDSQTWTFYKLSTIKGSVTIRWYGTSNGYYSESVEFYKEG